MDLKGQLHDIFRHLFLVCNGRSVPGRKPLRVFKFFFTSFDFIWQLKKIPNLFGEILYYLSEKDLQISQQFSDACDWSKHKSRVSRRNAGVECNTFNLIGDPLTNVQNCDNFLCVSLIKYTLKPAFLRESLTVREKISEIWIHIQDPRGSYREPHF